MNQQRNDKGGNYNPTTQVDGWCNNSDTSMVDTTEVVSPEITGEKQDTRFKPGVSGNPAGRPKGSISLTSAIKDRLKKLTPDGARTALDFLADNIIQDALDSNNKMRTLIWNYLDGMPKQSLDVGGSGELPFIIKIVKDDTRGTTDTTGTNS